jgi:trans-2-enoyl-CoA reductase
VEATVAKYTQHGRPGAVLKLEKQALPPVKDNQVLIKMVMAPINPADINMIEGVYPIRPNLPAIGGNEGVGQVVAVGKSVKGLAVQDMVIPSRPGFGTWRTHAVADETDLIKVDKTVKPENLACMAVNPCTAIRLLDDFVKLDKGDVIIQNGANSTVGVAVMQIAAARGIKTINIIRDRHDHADMVEKLKAYGGYIVDVDTYLNTPQFKRLIADLPKPKLALNCTGGPVVTDMARLLDDGATVVTYGAMSRKPVTMPSSLLIFKDIQLRGFWLSKWLDTHSAAERDAMYSQVTDLFKADKLRLWSERHSFTSSFETALERAQTERRERKVLLEF